MANETIEERRARVAQERREHYPARAKAVEQLLVDLRAIAKTVGFIEDPDGFEDVPGRVGRRLRLRADDGGAAAVSRYQDTLAFFRVARRGVSDVVPLVELDDLPVRFDPRAGRFVALDGESDVVDLLMEQLRYVCGQQSRHRLAC